MLLAVLKIVAYAKLLVYVILVLVVFLWTLEHYASQNRLKTVTHITSLTERVPNVVMASLVMELIIVLLAQSLV